jgi:murein DD-endopeptidase MepM/ murein hydrolase activator NlpD
VRLLASWPGTTTPSRAIDLGRLPTGVAQTLALPALADPALPEGSMSIRIAARDSAGRLLSPAAKLSRVQAIQIRGHVFPLQGTFSYGGADARFGASRPGHSHQGQDMLAKEGTPVVAVRSGTIAYSQYQAAGAGYYLVLDADGEDYDYAFMHLKEGSILVNAGDHVAAGQPLAAVGHTGAASADHLHFEVWQGAWYNGGHAIDPLPLLQQWQTWSDARTT